MSPSFPGGGPSGIWISSSLVISSAPGGSPGGSSSSAFSELCILPRVINHRKSYLQSRLRYPLRQVTKLKKRKAKLRFIYGRRDTHEQQTYVVLCKPTLVVPHQTDSSQGDNRDYVQDDAEAHSC